MSTLPVHYLLLTDGRSDRVLMPLIDMTITANFSDVDVTGQWVDERILKGSGARTTRQRIQVALRAYDIPDILFIHRDAEAEPYPKRIEEIDAAIKMASFLDRWVPIVPVRMQEAWLLVDEFCIRAGAGNPNGRTPLDIPRRNRIESIPDPKFTLHELLREASGLQGRRRRAFRPEVAAHRVVNFMGDIQLLRDLPAFQRFEKKLKDVLVEIVN